MYGYACRWWFCKLLPAFPAVSDAARTDDLAAVRKLIKEHADVNIPAADGSSALLWAAYHSNVGDDEGASCGGSRAWMLPNHYGVTPLLQASRNGDVEVMRALLDAGAQPTRWHAEGETPLMAAARTGKVDAIKLLLSRGSFVNAADPFQEETALMWASAEGHLEVVKTLLAAGADPNLKAHVSTLTERKNADHPSGGFTALMFAVRNGHEDVARALIAGGADPKLTNADGATATIIAIVNDRFDLAKELLDLGADPNDGSLFFAVDMHDGTTDMRAHDGSRMQPIHPNKLTALEPGEGAARPERGREQAVRRRIALDDAVLRRDDQQLAVLPRRDGGRRGGPEADAGQEARRSSGARARSKPKDGKTCWPWPNPTAGKTPLMAALKGGQGRHRYRGGPGSPGWGRRRSASPAAAIRSRR